MNCSQATASWPQHIARGNDDVPSPVLRLRRQSKIPETSPRYVSYAGAFCIKKVNIHVLQ